jgi:hypothetical protein
MLRNRLPAGERIRPLRLWCSWFKPDLEFRISRFSKSCLALTSADSAVMYLIWVGGVRSIATTTGLRVYPQFAVYPTLACGLIR